VGTGGLESEGVYELEKQKDRETKEGGKARKGVIKQRKGD